MAVPSMTLFFVFLPSLAAQLHSPVVVDIDGKGALVKEKPLVRKQAADEIKLAAILDDGAPEVTRSNVGHDTAAKVARKQHPNVEALLEKEDTTSASLEAETRGVKSAVSKDKPSGNKKGFSWDDDEDDEDTALDELEALTIAIGLRAKNDPDPDPCVWNSWTRSGGCRGTGACSCSCSGEQEYTRTKQPEMFGGLPCTEPAQKTEACAMPVCPATPAPTPPPTAPPTTTTLAGTIRTGSVNSFLLLGLFTAVLYNIR